MPGRRLLFGPLRRAAWALVVTAVWLGAWPLAGQMPPLASDVTPETLPPAALLAAPDASGPTPAVPEETVVDVRVVGNQAIPLNKIAPHIRTRPGRPFEIQVVEADVRRLTQSRMFVNVKTYSQRVEGGRVVVFEVLERPTIRYVHYYGNSRVKLKTLKKEAGLKQGDAFDTYTIEEARHKLEDYYHEKGYMRARVTLVEGDKPGDPGVEFLINEGLKQRILWTDFVGNSIATDSRLRTQIQSKPGFLWIFKGDVDRKKIDEDIAKLTEYYRALGFFQAKVGRELVFNESENWLRLTYVIDEGIRYKVRSVSVAGNTKFSSDDLLAKLKLMDGQYFNQNALNKDVHAMQDTYGGIGYVFADVKADPRFDEQPGQLDLVYNITEGDRCRVGTINVDIEGDAPRTQITTILNRMSLRPGDVMDIREVRASERRMGAAGLFLTDPASGQKPKIAFSPPGSENEGGDSGEKKTEVAREPNKRRGFRGQSPDGEPLSTEREDAHQYWYRQAAEFRSGERCAEPTVSGQVAPAQQPAAAPPSPAPPAEAPAASPPGPDPARPMLIRGQYTPDAGQSVPSGTPWSGWGRSRPSAAAAGSTAWSGYGQNAGGSPVSTAPQPAPAPLPATGPLPGPGFLPGISQPAVQPAPAPQGYLPSALQPQPAIQPAPAPALQPVAPPPVAPPPVAPPAPLRSRFLDAVDSIPGQVPPGGQPLYDNSPLYDATVNDGDLTHPIPLDVIARETETGKLMIGVGVNSDAGVMGSVVVDERNFDWTRFPTSWEDVRSGRAWRGNGEGFRIEAVPGTQLQSYMINFREPYLLGSEVGLGLSGYYRDRQYKYWLETRVGGRASLSYQFNHDLSGSFAFRGERVGIFHPYVPTPTDLEDALGNHGLYGFEFKLAHDTRDSPFLPTQGHLIELGFEQVVGDYQYPRANVDLRKHFTLYERPDGSGRHVLTAAGRLFWTGDNTPIYDRFYAGGTNTLRGFDFREVSPRSMGVTVGGDVMTLASLEYMFPITADDMLRGVVFCDTGTVEPSFSHWNANWRVAPGFGLRITVPFMGPAPIALDFAFPVTKEPGDQTQVFSFFVGYMR